MHGFMGGNWGYSGFAAFYMIFFWIVVLVGVILLIKFLVYNKSHEEKSKETPLEILRRRYASGEITKEEFENKKKDLGL